MRKQFLSVFVACSLIGVDARLICADTFVNATSVERYTNPANVQIYNLSNKNGGMLTVGPGTATDGTTRLDLPPGLAGTSPMRMESGVAPTTPVDGDIWYDSTRKARSEFVDGMTQYTPGVIYTSTGSATSITGTSESTITVVNTPIGYGSTTLPANSLVAGKSIRFSVTGQIGTSGTGPVSARFRVNLGTTPVLTSGFVPMALSISSKTFTWSGTIMCQSVGSYASSTGGTIEGGFKVDYSTIAASSSALLPGLFTIASSTNSSGLVDTTVANALNLTVTWFATDVGNLVIPNSIIYERLN